MADLTDLIEALENDIRFFDSIANHEHWEATGLGNLCRGYAARRRDLLAKASTAEAAAALRTAHKHIAELDTRARAIGFDNIEDVLVYCERAYRGDHSTEERGE